MTSVQPVTMQPQQQQQQYGFQSQPGMVQTQPLPGQPQPVSWMVKPQSVQGCPPGLEYMSSIDQLLVKQKIDMLELFTGWEQANKYQILNNQGQQVYYAFEESGLCMRQCCGANRGFTLHIVDNENKEVIRVNREFKCCAGCNWFACCDACAFTVTIEAPVGQTVGYIRQECTPWAPKYSIRTPDDSVLFRIEGPICIMPCLGGQDFNITSEATGENVGVITKQFSGLLREMFTTADNFGVTFPLDMDVRIKACMVGAVFLIDFMYYEEKQQGGYGGY